MTHTGGARLRTRCLDSLRQLEHLRLRAGLHDAVQSSLCHHAMEAERDKESARLSTTVSSAAEAAATGSTQPCKALTSASSSSSGMQHTTKNSKTFVQQYSLRCRRHSRHYLLGVLPQRCSALCIVGKRRIPFLFHRTVAEVEATIAPAFMVLAYCSPD